MCVHVSPHLSMWAELRFLHGALAAPSYTESPRHIAYPNLPEQLMQASYPTLLASLPVCQDGKQGTLCFVLKHPSLRRAQGPQLTLALEGSTTFTAGHGIHVKNERTKENIVYPGMLHPKFVNWRWNSATQHTCFSSCH